MTDAHLRIKENHLASLGLVRKLCPEVRRFYVFDRFPIRRFPTLFAVRCLLNEDRRRKRT